MWPRPQNVKDVVILIWCVLNKYVIFSDAAFEKIKRHLVQVNNGLEIGGLLLGYRIWKHHYIADVTMATGSAKTHFILDGTAHQQVANDISLNFWPPLSIVGVWHSHICDTVTFSEQDRISNRQLASILDGAVSMLVATEGEEPKCKVFYISRIGDEEPCCIKFK